MFDEQQLEAVIGEHFQHRGSTLFRMECLPLYVTDAEIRDFQRWLDGAAEPDMERKGKWLQVLRDEEEAGLISTRVRILSEEVTAYERFECDWAYRYNVPAGEDTRILHVGEHDIPDLALVEDFWIVNDAVWVPMYYDEHGRFEGADFGDHDRLHEVMIARDAVWAAAEPFEEWWARHPELHRARRAA